MYNHTRKFNSRGSYQIGLFLSIAVFFLFAASSAVAQSEEGIRAAFIYNFAKFTEWPDKTFASDSTPITIGFVGADSLADTFEKNVQGKNARGRDIAVKRLSGAAGGMIKFVKDGAKVTFDLDITAVSAVQLKLDDKLRAIARTVKGG